MIHESGLNRVIELLDTDLTYIAVGTGTASGYTSSTLTAEAYRNAVSESLVDGLTLVKELFIDTGDANVTMKEVGLFGSTASATTDSGKIFAGFGVNIVKDNTQSLTLSFETEVLEVV